MAPIALLGTFTVMLLAGFSINVLTMFGMVLAIGIIVDDAIVVVENVERIMATEGLSPKDATSKAMKETQPDYWYYAGIGGSIFTYGICEWFCRGNL